MDEIIRQIRDDLERCENALQQVFAADEERLQRLAGNCFEEICSSPDVAESFLANSNPDLRVVALHKLHEMDEDRAAGHCARMAMEDVSSGVRSSAVLLLVKKSNPWADPNLLDLAARVVLNERENPYVRLTAYSTIQRLTRTYSLDDGDPAEPGGEKLKRIDMGLVKRCLLR